MPNLFAADKTNAQCIRLSLTARGGLALGMGLVLIGCVGMTTGPTQRVAPSGGARPAASASVARGSQAVRPSLIGRVVAPAGIIGDNGGSVVSNNGGNATSGRYGLRSLDEGPVGGVNVVAADLAGRPLPGIRPAVTDPSGQFAFADLPPGTDVLLLAQPMAANGRPLLLQTLTRTTTGETRADINVAASLVSHEVLAAPGSAPPSVDIEAFARATAAVADHVTRENLPDLTDRAAILAAIDLLAREVAAIRAALADVSRKLDSIESKLDAITDKLNQPTPTPAPSATAGPLLSSPAGSPTSTGTPTPPSAAASPLPTATPTPPVIFDGLKPSGWSWFALPNAARYNRVGDAWVVDLSMFPQSDFIDEYRMAGIERVIAGDFSLEIEAEVDRLPSFAENVAIVLLVEDGGVRRVSYGRRITGTNRSFNLDDYVSQPSQIQAVETDDKDLPERFLFRLSRRGGRLTGEHRADPADAWQSTGEVTTILGPEVNVGLCFSFPVQGLPMEPPTVTVHALRLSP